VTFVMCECDFSCDVRWTVEDNFSYPLESLSWRPYVRFTNFAFRSSLSQEFVYYFYMDWVTWRDG
jgi:hypothetical protein